MSLPLAGVSVVVTRAQHQAPPLVEALEAAGAEVVILPVIEIVGLDSDFVVAGYEWLVVTSANTVEFSADAISKFDSQVAAVGPGTADALAAVGVSVDLLPQSFVAESLLEVFPRGAGRVLLPCAEGARDVLQNGLREKGWTVDVVHVYRSVTAQPPVEMLERASQADVVTFTSSSTVNAYLALVPTKPKLVACIGPVTAKTATDAGLNVEVEAKNHTIDGLVEALVSRLGKFF